MAFPTPPTEPITEIATDATYSAPGDAWDGEPTKVPPSSGVQAQGYVPGQPRPADADNWLFNAFAKWLDWLRECVLLLVEGPGSSVDNTIARFDGATGKLVQGSGVRITDGGEVQNVSPIPRQAMISPESFVFNAGWAYIAGLHVLRASAHDSRAAAPLPSEIPEGATITAIRYLVIPTDARGTSSNRMRALTISTARTFSGTPSVGPGETTLTDARDAGSAVVQNIESTGLSIVVPSKASAKITCEIVSGLTDGTDDELYGVQIDYLDPGPSAR